MMAEKLLIYGATGYTGNMLVRRAAECGVDFVVGGREARKVTALADELGVDAVVLEVSDTEALHTALGGVSCVLNVAGPFSATAAPVIDACLATATHYLDTTGELDVFALAHSRHEEALVAGVMLMPGVGWDVVPSDCIALRVATRVRDPQRLRIGLLHLGGVPSRGTLRTGLAVMEHGLFVRRSGEIVRTEQPTEPPMMDFGRGPTRCSIVSMGDLVTAFRSTGIGEIEVCSAGTRSALQLPEGGLDAFPEGPTRAQLDAWRAFAAAEVEGADGEIARSVVETISGYEYTAQVGILIAQRVLAGHFVAGFQSPASAYGVELVTDVGGRITDL